MYEVDAVYAAVCNTMPTCILDIAWVKAPWQFVLSPVQFQSPRKCQTAKSLQSRRQSGPATFHGSHLKLQKSTLQHCLPRYIESHYGHETVGLTALLKISWLRPEPAIVHFEPTSTSQRSSKKNQTVLSAQHLVDQVQSNSRLSQPIRPAFQAPGYEAQLPVGTSKFSLKLRKSRQHQPSSFTLAELCTDLTP